VIRSHELIHVHPRRAVVERVRDPAHGAAELPRLFGRLDQVGIHRDPHSFHRRDQIFHARASLGRCDRRPFPTTPRRDDTRTRARENRR